MEDKHAIALSAQDFVAEVLQSNVPVLVDFWASWCRPCRMLAPVIEQLSTDYRGRAKICKLDVDKFGTVAARYGVMSIPTVVLFNKGKEFSRFVGVRPKSVFENALDNLVS